MVYRCSESLLQMANVESVASSYERIAGGDGHGDRVHPLNNSWCGHGFRFDSLRQSRRCLTFRQSIDSVIIKDVCEVQIPPTCVDEVSGSYAKPVSITTHGDNGQSRISQTGTSGDWEYAAMECMESVRIHEVWSLTRPPNSQEDCHLVGFNLHSQKGHLNRVNDSKVPTTRAPVV